MTSRKKNLSTFKKGGDLGRSPDLNSKNRGFTSVFSLSNEATPNVPQGKSLDKMLKNLVNIPAQAFLSPKKLRAVENEDIYKIPNSVSVITGSGRMPKK